MSQIDAMVEQAEKNGRGTHSSYIGFKWAAGTLRKIRETCKDTAAKKTSDCRLDGEKELARLLLQIMGEA